MPLLYQGAQNIGLELGKTIAERDGQKVTVSLGQKGFQQNKSGEKESFLYSFDIKYFFTANPYTLTFENDKETLTYNLNSEKDLNLWRKVLKSRLNQRGFHEQFKAIKRIGKGNFASVYLVEKHEDGNKYAVKAFAKQAAYSQEKGKQCLMKEIQIMRHLSNPNNMALHEIFESENSLYLVFELLEGGSLHERIRAKYRFKIGDIREVIGGILKGLKQMSAKKIMHRDLKPQNLLFRKQGDFDCIIADFGLAEFSECNPYLFFRCGTPGYVAPEIINSKNDTIRYNSVCDMFSLGLIFHLLLFNKSAFSGKNYDEVLSQNRKSQINLVGEQFHKHGEMALDLLTKMLRKNPEQRISAADALKHPFFTKHDTNELTNEIETMSIQKNDGKYLNCDSPLYASNNPNRKVLNKKDSCLDFKLGKQNVMNGKVDTIGNSVSPKISMDITVRNGASRFAKQS